MLWTGSVLLASLGAPVLPVGAQDMLPPAPIADAPMTLNQRGQ